MGRGPDREWFTQLRVLLFAVVSLPEFIIGSLLIVVFFSWLDVLPPVSLVPPGTSPLERPEILVLPTLTLLGATLYFCTAAST